MTAAIQTGRLTRVYLTALPLLLLTGGMALILAFWLAPPTPAAVGLTAYLLLGIFVLSGLISAAFLIGCYRKTQPPTAYLLVMAIGTVIVGLHLGILFSIAVYAITLYIVRRDANRSKKSRLLIILPIVIVILLTLALCSGFIWILTGDHYYSEPTVGKGGFYHTELIDATLVELTELDDAHCIGVYSTANADASREIGFVLYETKNEDGKPLYCYLDDSGLCYPSPDAISEMDGESYTVSGHDENGFPERQTRSWRTWHRLSDGYAICIIPASSECLPEEGIEIVHSAEVTLGDLAFRLYVGMGDVE